MRRLKAVAASNRQIALRDLPAFPMDDSFITGSAGTGPGEDATR